MVSFDVIQTIQLNHYRPDVDLRIHETLVHVMKLALGSVTEVFLPGDSLAAKYGCRFQILTLAD